MESIEIYNKYYCSDCLDLMPKLPSNIFDLLILDPPNLILAKHFATRKFFKRSFGDLGLVEHFYKHFFKEFERVIKDTGLFYIFCNESSYPFFWFYTYSFTKKLRLLIWDKIVSINGYHWRHQSELILFGIMPNAPTIKTGDGDIIRCRAVPVKKRKHPAEKPLELLDKLILKSSRQNDLVGDLFAGSGTTLISAQNNNRKYFGIEYDHNYFEIIKKNLKKRQLRIG